MNLSYFSQNNFYNSLKQFFSDLHIPINPVTEAPDSADSILSDTYNANNPAHKLMDDVYFVGMVLEDAFTKQREIKYTAAAKDIKTKDYDCMLLFGVILKAGRTPSRGQLAEITRAFNRQFSYYPVVVIFKYGESIAFANCERLAYKQAWRGEGERPGKVSLLKDIAFNTPHTGHLKILQSLAIPRTGGKAVTTFAGLYKYWQEVFSVSILNKSFYQELSNWYFWALSEISFPDDSEKNEVVRTAENSIRLITRLIFVWFLKEKGLVPDELFDKKEMDKLLDYRKDKTGSAYYRAILQNLFFATLNVPMDEREFRDEKRFQGKNYDYMNHRLYRYAELFKKANSFQALFGEIPFLNGGLFDCLDHPDENGKVVRIDCYSDNPKNAARLTVPDKLFFGSDVVDLSGIYDDKKKKEVPVRGIIDILNSYKFTIAENTPVEEEIALDPELLGRVFENLLASYNPETQTTARKQTGSFYTPREIVNYMVDESLKAYLATTLGDDENTKIMLDQVLDYGDDLPELTEKQRQQIIAALEDAKILDPACGSGAFPMGILQKMVRVLEKLDPKNERWKQALIKRTPLEIRKETEKILAENSADYIRKLGIIQNCIYGVDIQPIAIQVSKLRFFISLLVDFSVDKSKHNFGIQPLPNLDYKLMQGNSLIEDFHGFTLNLKEQDTADDSGHLFCENSKVVSLIEDLWEKQADYLRESRPKQKEKLREEVENDIVNIFDTYIRQKKAPYFTELKKINEMTLAIPNEKTREDYLKAEKAKLDKKYDFDYVAVEKELKYFTHGEKPRNFFPWQLYFADVFKKKGGFDVVIGNPPYGAKFSKEEKKLFLKQYLHQDYQLDSYLLFTERAFGLLLERGVVSFILPNTWLQSVTYIKFRKYLSNSYNWLNILHLNNNVFDAVVDTMVIVFEKPGKRSTKAQSVLIFTNDDRKILLSHELDWNDIPQNGDPINIVANSRSQELYKKIVSSTRQLSTICSVFNGVKPFEKGKGNPPQTEQTMKEKPFVLEGSAPNKTWTPLLRGSLIHRYKILWDNNYWIQYGPWLAAPRDAAIFKAPQKIMVRQTGDSIIATLVSSGFVARNNLHILLPKTENYSLKFLLGLLNSKVMDFVYSFMNPEKGEAMAEVKKLHVEQLPIPIVLPEKQSPIVVLVEQILAAKKPPLPNPPPPGEGTKPLHPAGGGREGGGIPALEAEINRLVYALYNLTDEEIAVVEGKA